MSNMKWEYKVERNPYYDGKVISPFSSYEKNYLLDKGKDRWELCGSPVTDSMGSSWIYYWKRQITETK